MYIKRGVVKTKCKTNVKIYIWMKVQKDECCRKIKKWQEPLSCIFNRDSEPTLKCRKVSNW